MSSHGPGAAIRLRATSHAAPAIVTAAIISRRSVRSEIAAIGKTPMADPSTIEEVKRGTLAGAMPISTAKIGPSANRAPFAAPAASAAQHEIGALRASHRRRGRTLRGEAGGSTLVIAIGRMASARNAAATAKGEKPPGPRGFSASWPLADAAKLAIW